MKINMCSCFICMAGVSRGACDLNCMHMAACGLKAINYNIAVDGVAGLSLPAACGRTLSGPPCGLQDRMRSALGVLSLAVCVFCDLSALRGADALAGIA